MRAVVHRVCSVNRAVVAAICKREQAGKMLTSDRKHGQTDGVVK
jgi:hypothetical protein